jgi:hypothetical protein
MSNYVRELRVGEIISGTFALYRQNIGALLLLVAVPCVPFFLVGAYMGKENLIRSHLGAYLALLVINVVVALVVTGIATILISDVCVGNKARPARAARHVVTSVLGGLISTSLLQSAAMIGGFLLLLVPGVIFASWFIVAPVVVVLEGRRGRHALTRSKQLGKGFYLRSLAIFAVLSAIGSVVGGVVGGIAGLLAGEFFNGSPWPVIIATSAIQAMLTPASLVAVVLIYYDLRVRKEGFSMTQLSEELRL